MARISIKTIKKYIELKENLPSIIEDTGLMQKYIYEKLDMSRPTWTRKLRDGKFTEKEMLAIAKIIN